MKKIFILAIASINILALKAEKKPKPLQLLKKPPQVNNSFLAKKLLPTMQCQPIASKL
ncbi:MAG: hypothetical protein IPF62_05305 [Bacteroidetes bacterium]|nr:hypothetical protein [Bacteroidota bacterium]